MTLVELPVKLFLDRVAGDSATPGGGSVAALAGALSAALCAMVARLTVGKEKYQEVCKEMERVRDGADRLGSQLQELVEEDTAAYNLVVAAYRLPKDGGEQKAIRRQSIEEATKQAALVPLETLRKLAELVDLVAEVVDKGNPNGLTDAGVAAQLIRAAATGAAYNVRINVSGMAEKDFASRLEDEVTQLLGHITKSVDRMAEAVERGLG